ncbi:MAG: hypothetical protein WC523_04120 [Patescibacteria group bacterium]
MTDDITLKSLSLSELAKMIRKDWTRIDSHALPFLEAMEQLKDIADNYKDSSGQMIIAYFLSTAVSWTGNLSVCIKKELKRRMDENKEKVSIQKNA